MGQAPLTAVQRTLHVRPDYLIDGGNLGIFLPLEIQPKK